MAILHAKMAIDWLEKANGLVPAGEDCGYKDFMSGIDAIVMGRHTFELVQTFGNRPYGDTPVTVLSRSLTALPDDLPPTVSLSGESPEETAKQLGKAGCKSLYIDDGLTIQSFLRAGLISRMIITAIPVLIGSGRPLFGPLESDIPLHLTSSRTFPFGFVQNEYWIADKGDSFYVPEQC